jgi:hypothetical protein
MGSNESRVVSSDDENQQPSKPNGSFLHREGERQELLRQLENIAAAQSDNNINPTVSGHLQISMY